MEFADKIKFLLRFIKSPGQIGSITPSSQFLTRQMLSPVDWKRAHAVAELGAGTGVFTSNIVEQMQGKGQVLIFEKDPNMHNLLARKFPDIPRYSEASRLSQEVSALGLKGLDAVISGLPFANFPQEKRELIIEEIIHSLRPEGVFVMFQYSLQMKSLLSKRFSRMEIHFVPWNIPPAFVYVCRK